MNEPQQSTLSTQLKAFNDQMGRIDDLEQRIDAWAVKLRRRMTNRLHHAPPFRNSHLRVFCTHQWQPPVPEQQRYGQWTLQIEGKLLIGHLDHASAEAYDKKTGYTAPTDDLDRSKGEPDEEPVVPIRFSHFFQKVAVQLQTIYQPKPEPIVVVPKKSTKSSRRGSATKSPVVQLEEIDPRLLRAGPATPLVWTPHMTTRQDAHALEFQYPYHPPPYASKGQQVHSVVAKIQLYYHHPEPIYQVRHAELAAALFPSYGDSSQDNKNKRKLDEISASMLTAEALNAEVIPLDNEIDIPLGLTMKEIANAFFVYIQDNQLADEGDKSLVNCNALLSKVFGDVEQVPFCNLQHELLSRNLLRNVSQEPVRLTYILKHNTATPLSPQQPAAPKDKKDDVPMHALLQLDMDMPVPSLFPCRVRELLRRVKRRELEYTSSRTKARYLLQNRVSKTSTNTDDVDAVIKEQIDAVVAGRQPKVGEHLPTVLLALAKSAPPGTEARAAGPLDAQICYLTNQLQEAVEKASEAEALVEAYQLLGTAQEGAQDEEGDDKEESADKL